MVRAAAAGLVMLLLLAGPVLAQPDEDAPPKRTFGTIVAETGAGLGGGVLIGGGVGLVGYLALFAAASSRASSGEPVPLSDFGDFALANAVVVAGTAVSYLCGCGAGVNWAGSLMQQEGRLSAAVWGSFAGAAAAVGTGLLVRRVEAFVAGGLVLCPTGAVVGYNLSRPKPDDVGSTWSRAGPPMLSLRTERLDQAQKVTVMSLDILSVGF